jgi:hypothetical protein
MTQPTLTRKVRLNKRPSFCSATSAGGWSKPITRNMPMPRAASYPFFVSLTRAGVEFLVTQYPEIPSNLSLEEIREAMYVKEPKDDSSEKTSGFQESERFEKG